MESAIRCIIKLLYLFPIYHMDVRNIVCHDTTNLYMYSNLTSYWTMMMANNRQYMLNEYDNLHIGQKTMVTLVYQMKTNKRPSLLVTNLIVPC